MPARCSSRLRLWSASQTETGLRGTLRPNRLLPDEKEGLDSVDRDYCAFGRGSERSAVSEFGCKPVKGRVERFWKSSHYGLHTLMHYGWRFYGRR